MSKTKAPAKVPTYHRAYSHSLMGANWSKVEKVLALFGAYSALAVQLRGQQLQLLLTAGKLNKNAPIVAATALSARYQQTCQYQVVAMLDSWLALRQDDFRQLVLRSSIDGDLRHELLALNIRKAWYRKDLVGKRFTKAGEPEKLFTHEGLRLAQHLMRHLRQVHQLPNMRNINLALDEKVATIEHAELKGAFPWWVKLSTLEIGKPMWLPVKGNANFEQAGGKLKPFVQINLSAETGLSAAFIKEFERKEYTPKTSVLALDSGLSVFFATDHGDLLGAGLFAQLQALDQLITDCAKGRQQRGLRVRSPRYDALVQRVRGLLKCEIGRILNTLIARLAPAEIVMEALDFRNSNMSKRMNRLISNFGRGIVKDKLAAFEEEYGIVVTEVPAAYTSQECPNCHHVEKRNRKTRDAFCCKKCKFKRHADVVGARNIRSRRSWSEAKAGFGLFMRREVVLSRVWNAHQMWCAHHYEIRRKWSSSSGAPPLSDNRSELPDTGSQRSSLVVTA